MNASTSISLVLGAAGSAAATFFWTDGRYGVTGGTILVLAMVVWGYGLIGLFQAIRARLPRYSAVALPAMLYGVMGGAAFGFQGFFESAFGLTGDESLTALDRHPVAANLLLWIPGPLMPLSLLVLGAVLGRHRLVPGWVAGVVCLGAAIFPVSRIPRIALLAHAADLVLVAAFVLVVRYLRIPEDTAPAPDTGDVAC